MSVTKLFFVELAGLGFLVPLVYYWLTIPESSTGQLLWSLLVGMFAVALVAFLLGLGLLRDWRKALSRTHWLCFFVFGFLLWVALCMRCEPYFAAFSRWLASWLTSLVRMPIAPDFFWRGFGAGSLARVSFVVVAPVAAWLAAGERSRWPRTPRYWGMGLLYLVVGLLAPVWIFSWVPGVTGPAVEVASFTLRTLLALALAVAAWIWFAAVVRREIDAPPHAG